MSQIQTEESESEKCLWGQGAKEEDVIDLAINQDVDMKLNHKTQLGRNHHAYTLKRFLSRIMKAKPRNLKK